MKKRLISTVVLAGVLLTVPVLAADLSDVSPAGDTAVTAKVVADDPGSVTYVVSIPDKIDFGDLEQPADSYSHPKDKDATVTAETITGLSANYRVAVFVKDAADTAEDPSFRVIGQDPANQGKVLTYTIKNNSTDAYLTEGTRYTNGYFVGLFEKGAAENDGNGDSVKLRLSLDQAQLFDEYLPEWAGNYTGTLNFYTAVSSVGTFN